MGTISICCYCTSIVMLPKHKRCFRRALYPSPNHDSIPLLELRRDTCLLIVLHSATGFPDGAMYAGQPHIAFMGPDNLLPILPGPALVLVFVTGRGGAGFHFVTPPLLRPGVNSLPFLPAPYDTGHWPGCGAGRVFYFPR